MKILKLTKNNKAFFNHNDKVQLELQLKNIKSLQIKVFEIQPLKYLKKNQELDPNMDLNGLIPQEIHTHAFTEPEIQSHLKTFNIPLASNQKLGIFIIEFVEQSQQCRAIIKKGSLNLVQKPSLLGNNFKIYDLNGDQVKDNIGIFLQNRFFSPNELGDIIIPYGKKMQNQDVILSHYSYAQKYQVSIKDEQYELTCQFIYDVDNLLPLRQAKIIVKPRLYLNNIETSLKIIENFKLSLKCQAVIPQNQEIILDGHRMEQFIEFLVPNNLVSIDLEVTGKIEKIDKNFQEMRVFQQINLSQCQNIQNQYLKKFENSLQIFLKGKNGEAIKNISLNLEYFQKFSSNAFKATLLTDQEGKVTINNTKYLTMLESEVIPKGDINKVSNHWYIDEDQLNQDIPQEIQIQEGETIKLPCHTDHYHLLQEVRNSPYENQTNKIENLGNKIQIKSLKEGDYVLTIQDQQIDIKVIKPMKIDQKYLFTQSQIFESSQLSDLLFIEKVKLDKEKLSFQIPKNARCLVIGSHFMPNFIDVNKKVLELKKLNLDNYPLFHPQNIFLQNRQISSEIQYVLDRKIQNNYVGNSLDKSAILIKPLFYKETNYEDEQLNQQNNYEEEIQAKPLKLKKQALKPEKKMNSLKNVSAQKCQEKSSNIISEFLQNQSLILENILSYDGKVEINQDLTKYSVVQIIVITNDQIYQKNIYQNSNSIDLKDIRQKKQVNFNFSTQKMIDCKLKEESLILKQNNKGFRIINNLEKLFSAFNDVFKNLNPDVNLTKYIFLKNWHLLSLDDKINNYSQNICNEINYFLFKHDQKFFKVYIQETLENKIEKDFMDYYLLNDVDNVLSYHVDQINLFEICLMIEVLKKNGYESQACQLNNLMKDLKQQNCKTETQFNKLFNLIFKADKIEELEVIKKVHIEKNLEENRRRMAEPVALFGSAQAFGGTQQISQNVYQSQSRTMMQPKRMMRKCQAPQQQTARIESDCEFEQQSDYSSDGSYDRGQDFLDYGSNIQQIRQNVQPSYQADDKTHQFVETHYINHKQQNTFQVSENNPFWYDFAESNFQGQQSFVSKNIIYCYKNISECILAMATMDIVFEEKIPIIESKSDIKLVFQSNSIIFYQDLIETQQNIKDDLNIGLRFFQQSDRFMYNKLIRQHENEQIQKNVDEYVINTIYGCQVIVTNLSVTKQQINAMAQIPEGSVILFINFINFQIPVLSSIAQVQKNIILESFQTKTFEIFFYFPNAGKFSIAPANLTKNYQIVAQVSNYYPFTYFKAQSSEFLVNEKYSQIKVDTINQVIEQNDEGLILDFLKNKNLSDENIFNVNLILPFLNKKAFYIQVYQILKERFYNFKEVLRFSVDHCHMESFYDYLKLYFSDKIKYFNSKNLKIENIRFFEFNPMMKMRVHELHKDKSNILNKDFKQAYEECISYMTEKDQLSNQDLIILTYYMILQDRIDEAISLFNRIQNIKEHIIQYDYLTCYLEFYQNQDFDKVRLICIKYLDFPIIQWRNKFFEIANLLCEYDGEELVDSDVQIVQKNKDQLKKEEIMECEILENKSIQIRSQNINQLTIQYYLIDLEMLFSKSPFMQEKDDFNYITPNYIQNCQIDQEIQTVQLLQAIQNKNVFIQINSKEKTQVLTYNPCSFLFSIYENYGILKIESPNKKVISYFNNQFKALSKVYVKVFKKLNNGNVIFHKDGYTDICGRFDYASSSENLEQIKSFSILILSQDYGSLTKQVSNVTNVGKLDEPVQLKGVGWKNHSVQQQQTRNQHYLK